MWCKERLESERGFPLALATQRKRYFHVEPSCHFLRMADTQLCQLTPQSYRGRKTKSLQPALIPTPHKREQRRLLGCSCSMLWSSRRRKGQFSPCYTCWAWRVSHGLPHGNHFLSFERLSSQLWVVLVALYTTVLSYVDQNRLINGLIQTRTQNIERLDNIIARL